MSEQANEYGREEQRKRSFNPNEHLMQLRSKEGAKDYLPVQWRLVWFRDQCPHGTIILRKSRLTSTGRWKRKCSFGTAKNGVAKR